MRILQIVLLALVGTSLAVLLKGMRPELAVVVGVVTGVTVLLAIVGELSGLFDTIRALASEYGLDEGYLGVLVKIVGIAYAAQFGADVCRDAGEAGTAAKVELAGRVLILASALPVAAATLAEAARLLGNAS